MHKGFNIPWAITWQEKVGIPLAISLPSGLTTLAEFIYPEITQEQFLGK